MANRNREENTEMAKRWTTEEMATWTREDVSFYAYFRWSEWMEKHGHGEDTDVEEFADRTIAEIDEDIHGDIHGDIDLAMEAWARGTWEGTPWE